MIHNRSNAIVTTDRYGNRAYVWSDGNSVVQDGAYPMVWSLYRIEDKDTWTYASCNSYYSDRLFDAIGNI